MWNKFRQFMTDLAPPYRSDYMDRHVEIQAAYERLRDEFAMAALTGLLQQGYDRFDPEEWACQAYRYADAMMRAREKGDV